MRKRAGVVAIVTVIVLGTTPLIADAGGPILDYLRSTVKPLLDSAVAQLSEIQTSLENLTSTAGSIDGKTDAIVGSIGTLDSRLASLDAKVDAIETRSARTTRLVAVTTSFLTQPSSANGVNLDVAGSLPRDRIKRYTVSVHWGELRLLSPMTGQVSVINSVEGAGTPRQLDPQIFDPSGKSGAMIPPYTGTNSFVQVGRGPDGLGEIEVFVNAFIELEQ